MKVQISELESLAMATLKASFPEEESKRILEVLIWADMSGISPMGIAKLAGTEPIQDIKSSGEITIERETKLSRLINAQSNPAPYVCQIATDVAIEKAKVHGFGIVGINNYFSSTCAQGFYVKRIADQGLVGIMMSRPAASTAPYGSIDPVLGTNPIGFALPTTNEPLLFDMTTSTMTWTGLVLAKLRGESIPENIALDKDGNPTIDPAAAMKGALLTFDRSYKSSGLALIIEALAGPLVGASFGQIKGDWGALFIAIDPELLVDSEKFKHDMSDLIDKIKRSRKQQGVSEIRMPGERALRTYAESLESGTVDIDKSLLQELGYLKELEK